MFSAVNARLTFGLYEVDLQAGELWKAGFRIKLQSQPFKVLAVLLERPGQVVLREELQERLWGKDTVVDFDHSLGTAINKIREALGDSADNPRFIETLSRRGYRFIAPVNVVESPNEPQVSIVVHDQPLESAPAETPNAFAELAAPANAIMFWAKHRSVWVAVAVGVVTTFLAGFFAGARSTATTPPHIMQITHNGHLAPSVNNLENLAALATDGVHLFAATIDDGRSLISAISLPQGVSMLCKRDGEGLTAFRFFPEPCYLRLDRFRIEAVFSAPEHFPVFRATFGTWCFAVFHQHAFDRLQPQLRLYFACCFIVFLVGERIGQRLHAVAVDTRPDDVAVLPSAFDMFHHDTRLIVVPQLLL